MKPLLRKVLWASLFLQASCALAPPPAQTPPLATAAPLAADPGQAGGEWPSLRWWEVYADPTLHQLIDRALASAPAIATAEARFGSAREAVRVAAAAGGLQVDGQAGLTRQRLSDNGLFPPEFLGFNWYNQADIGVQARYTFDWWHRRRALLAASLDEARAAQAEREAASITLAATLCDAYFAWQSLQARLAVAREETAVLERQRAVLAARVAAQLEPADSVYPFDLQLAELRARVAALEGSARLQVIALAAYVGVSPAELPELRARPLPAVQSRLPENARIDLIGRRADIAASRWRVEAAQQQLAVARADFMPDISLNALAALSSIDLGKLFDAGSAAPSVGAALNLPIFDNGLLKARYGERAAQVQAAAAAYHDALLNAAREVATQVQNLSQIAAQREQQQAKVAAAEKLLAAHASRVRQGLSDLRPQLAAMQTLLTARDELIALDAAAVSADIALKLALGGGYNTPTENNSPSMNDTPS